MALALSKKRELLVPRREDAVLKRVLSTPPKEKTAKDDTAKKRGRTTNLSRGEISRGEKKDRNNT
jgi:hypothetical protein